MVHLPREVGEGGERAFLRTSLDDLCDDALPHVAHSRQPVADRSFRRRREVGLARVDVGRLDGDVQGARLREVRRAAIRVVLDARQQRGHVLDRMVRPQVARLVRDEPVARGVRAIERVTGERLDQLP